MGSITDVRGIKVGHSHDLAGLTGLTVVLCEDGARGAVYVPGGAPGTRETDLLSPSCTVDVVHGVLLAGGSAFGLNAAEGVVRYLEEKGIGFNTGQARVPIVPAAVIYDLGIGDWRSRPTSDMAYAACQSATSAPVGSGNVGAGAGATVGKLFGQEFMMKSGLGNASVKSAGGYTVGAMFVVNAAGDVYHPETGKLLAGAWDRVRKEFVSASDMQRRRRKEVFGEVRDRQACGLLPGTCTTIGVVAVDAPLTKAECERIAIMSSAGLARTIRPCFTPYDGDSIFVISTGLSDCGSSDLRAGIRASLLLDLGMAAQEAVALAIVDAVVSCTSAGGVPSASDARGFADTQGS